MPTPTLRGSALQARSTLPAVLATIAGLMAGQAQAQSVKIVGMAPRAARFFFARSQVALMSRRTSSPGRRAT